MQDELAATLPLLAERLLGLASRDSELRLCLRRMASAILACTEETLSAPPGEARPCGDEAAVRPCAPVPGTTAVAPAEPPAAMEARPAPLVHPPAVPVPMTARAASIVQPGRIEDEFVPAPRWVDVEDAELPLIESRCRLKAEGARWAATRRQRIAAGADFRVEIEPLDREIIDRAKKLPDCFLWMCHPSGPSPSDLSAYADVAGCFDAVASGVALVRTLLGETDGQSGLFEQALDLLAEAQSALRMSIARLGGGTDADQTKVFHWLRSAATQHQLFIRRFMRIDDPADPTAWSDIGERIQAVDSVVQADRQRHKRHQQALGRVRYHLGQLAKDNGDAPHHWNAIVQAVEALVQDGIPPSSTSIRELLLPVAEDVPDMEMPPGFRLVMREIDRYLATRPSEQSAPAGLVPTAEVKSVAAMLAAKTVILIGGVPRPHAIEALKTAFNLSDVDWIETREHESIANFEPHVARPDAALVLLAIRWSSHVFGDVKQFCDRHGKPLVRLPGGYNPNQVAAQILAQVSGKLRDPR